MAEQETTKAIVHLNGSKNLDNLLGHLKLNPKVVKFDKKKKISLNEGPVIETQDGTLLSGINTVSKVLVELSNQHCLLGHNEFNRAEIDQWLGYCQCYILPVSEDQALHRVFKELNEFLSEKSFFVDDQLSLADLLLYTHLLKKMETGTSQDVTVKNQHGRSQNDFENYINLSRWFNLMQNLPGVRQKSPYIPISRTLLYS